MPNHMWFVYVIRSINNKFIYLGSTNDVERRLHEHNTGRVQSTKPYAPYKLISYIAVETEDQARTLEKYFKKGSGKAILFKRILGSNPLADEAPA